MLILRAGWTVETRPPELIAAAWLWLVLVQTPAQTTGVAMTARIMSLYTEQESSQAHGGTTIVNLEFFTNWHPLQLPPQKRR